MEGELQQCTKGIFGGNKKVYAMIEGSDFVVLKSAKDQKEILRVLLDNQIDDGADTEVGSLGKGASMQFVLTCGDPKLKDKKKKYFFKANSPEETQLWLLSINKFTKTLSEEQISSQLAGKEKSQASDTASKQEESSDTEEIEQKIKSNSKKQKQIEKAGNKKLDSQHQENLTNAFQSRLFVDDCDLNMKIKMLSGVQELFKQENTQLKEMIDADQEKYGDLQEQVKKITNLSNTMETLISNLIEEVDESRGQMFGILENIALEQAKSELNKNNKKKVDPKKIQKKKNQLLSGSFNTAKLGGSSMSSTKQERVSRETTSSMMIPSRSKSISVRADRNQDDFDDLAVMGMTKLNSGDKGFAMDFEDDEEQKQDLILDNSSDGQSQSSSSTLNVDPKLILEDDDDDDEGFEDASEGFEEDNTNSSTISVDKQMKKLSTRILVDCPFERLQLPILRDPKIKASAYWQILKDLVGKDITKYSMPVYMNEPLSALQKQSECFYNLDLIEKANLQECSLRRLAYVSAYSAVSRHFVQANRTFKPFNPLLGETFEIVTPKFRAINELVSHHPPIIAMHCQGENFEIEKTSILKVQFTGKALIATDPNYLNLTLAPLSKVHDAKSSETYKFNTAKVIIGNLIIGETYVEPQGAAEVVNLDTGERCDIDYKLRGWSGRNKDALVGVIKDNKGKIKYNLNGKFTDKLELKNMETGESEVIWQANDMPESSNLMYNMNSFSLQLNLLTDELKEKLPPTDSRMRPDVRAWEEGKVEEASAQKDALEQQQRARKRQLKADLGEEKVKGDDWTYYKPKYFKLVSEMNNGEITYEFMQKNERGSNYWEDREKLDWSHMPRIYDKDCPYFFE